MLWYLMQLGNCYMVGMGSHTVVNPLKGKKFSSLLSSFCFFSLRYVVEYGVYWTQIKVEVYLVGFKLCVHPQINELKVDFFSRACTIGKTHYSYVQLTSHCYYHVR